MSFSQTSGQPLENRPVISPEPSKGWGPEDRAGLGALRTRPSLAKRKFFTSSAALSAKLFTAGAADEEGFAVALLPRQ
jgi:hypothetical protein